MAQQVKLTMRGSDADRTMMVSISPSGEVSLVVNNIPSEAVPDLLEDLVAILRSADSSEPKPRTFSPQPMGKS